MSDRSLTGGGSFVRTMYRRSPQGRIIQVETQPNEYTTPPRGTRGRFVLNGIGDVYNVDGQYGPQQKVQVEFLIENGGKGKEHLNGKKFSQSFPWPKNIADERSKLGQLISALLERPIREGETITPDDFIGTSFVTSTTLDDALNKRGEHVSYAGISWQTIEAGSIRLSPYVTAAPADAQPELVGVGAATVPAGAADDDDPFQQSEEL